MYFTINFSASKESVVQQLGAAQHIFEIYFGATAEKGEPLQLELPLGARCVPQDSAPTQSPNMAFSHNAEAPAKRRGRKPKTQDPMATLPVVDETPPMEQPEEKVEITVAKPSEPSPSATPSSCFSKEEVMQSLQAVSSKCGIDGARSVLKQFQASRISEVKPEDYSAFVEACAEALAA